MAEADVTFVEPEGAGRELERLIGWASRAGLDVLAVEDAEAIVDLLLNADPDDDMLLDVFHDYVHFRLETDPDDAWADVHESLEELLDDVGGLPAVLGEAAGEWARQDPGQRRAALAGTRIVDQVGALLAWIGKGRAITDSGALRRADIAPVAGLLGIRARGVAKLPPGGEYRDGGVVVDGESLVTSMWDLPSLAAWWEALRTADLVELTPSRARPGPAASVWTDELIPPLEEAAMVVSVFTAHLLTSAQTSGPDVWNSALLRLTVLQAIDTLEPGAVDVSPDAFDDLLMPRARRALAHLADSGVLHETADDTFAVPNLLRGPFAQGIVLSLAFIDENFDGEAEDDAGDGSPFDDPAVRAELARLGIVHTPGMAAEMMRELSPLLAEEGIDLDHLEANVDLDVVNAALARATERRNMELFTPVGEQRAMALTVHRLISEALAEGSVDLARVVIDGIQPDPVGTMPSAAQVIGVGLGILDQWHRDPALAAALKGTTIPAWDAVAVRAARDILDAARDGAAFAELGTLHKKHHGKLVLEGTLLAVAGAVAALAAIGGESVREAASRLLDD